MITRNLSALNNRALTLYQAGKYGDAIPFAEQFVAGTKARFGENAPQHAIALALLAQLYEETNRLADAEPLFRRVIAISEQNYGPDHAQVAHSLGGLAGLYLAQRRYAEAEALMRRALAIDEKAFGPDHPTVAGDLNTLAGLLMATNRFSEAESAYRRVIEIAEKTLGPDNPNVAITLANLAKLLHDTNRFAEAEPMMRRALAIHEKSFGPNHPNVARRLNNLAELLRETNRLAEAEPLYRRALAIDEKSLGPGHPDVAMVLSNLALMLQAENRFSEAEPMMRRALKIDEAGFGPDHPNVGIRLNNLGELLRETNRPAEAEPLMRRALAIDEKSLGPDHQEVANRLNNLALLLADTNRFAEAETNFRRALAISEKTLGPDHPDVANRLGNLGMLLASTDRPDETEPLFRRALAINEKSLGPGHPEVAQNLMYLIGLLQDQGRWSSAVALFRRAKPIITGSYGSGEPRRDLAKAVLARNAGELRGYARALYHAGAGDAASRAEGFELAQWAMQNEAAAALSSMAVRFAQGGSGLARLVREQQDLISERERAYRILDAAAGKADTQTAEAARTRIAAVEAKLKEKLDELHQSFPDYGELANPRPVSQTDAQALLGEGEALVLFLDLRQMHKVPEETIVFALTQKEARWTSIALGSAALRERVMALRCGLDSANWRLEKKSREVCKALLDTEVTEEEIPPFDAAAALALYRDLFGGIEDLIQGKRLLVVPSGALTQLPFEALVTGQPGETLPRFEAYKAAVWLGQQQAITVLPSVGSLKALRAAKASAAPAPFIGFGNPLLTGLDGADKSAWAKQDCGKAVPPKQTRISSFTTSVVSLFRGGAANLEDLRRQAPLPETADELCSAGRELGVPVAELDKAIYLGSRATVSQVKALSQSGTLARARVIHFATHGLLAGETALFAKNKAEPALLLTPPAEASNEDNGLLTASEVAQLNLNADWVVISACNTAAGSSEGAEALSGLARSFFYAGARSLLVSHWEVDSEAAVAITTGAVKVMTADPKVGRAEALHRSLAALIAQGRRFAHPSVWAPFVLVGNGEQ